MINRKAERAQFTDICAVIPYADPTADPVGRFRWCLGGCVCIAAKVNAEFVDIETRSVGSGDTPGNAAGDAAGILVPGLNVVGFARVDGHTGTGDIRVGAAAAFPALERYSSNRAVPSGSPRSLSAHADRFIIAAQAGHIVPGTVLCGQAKTCADVTGIRVIAGRGQPGRDDVVYSPRRHRILEIRGVGDIKICGALRALDCSKCQRNFSRICPCSFGSGDCMEMIYIDAAAAGAQNRAPGHLAASRTVIEQTGFIAILPDGERVGSFQVTGFQAGSHSLARGEVINIRTDGAQVAHGHITIKIDVICADNYGGGSAIDGGNDCGRLDLCIRTGSLHHQVDPIRLLGNGAFYAVDGAIHFTPDLRRGLRDGAIDAADRCVYFAPNLGRGLRD